MIANRFKPGTISKMRTLFRFEQQNVNWKLGDYSKQTNAFAYGLCEARIQPGAKALFWLDENHSIETTMAAVGCFKAGVSVKALSNQITDPAELLKQINKENPDILIFSPNQKISSENKLNLLNRTFSDLTSNKSHKPLKLKANESIKHIIQTGFYEKKGTVKFRDFLLYRDQNMSSLSTLSFKDKVEALFQKDDKALDSIKPEDYVFYAGSMDNLSTLQRVIVGSSLSGYVVNILSSNVAEKANLNFINDLEREAKCHILVNEKNEKLLKERVTHVGANFVKVG